MKKTQHRTDGMYFTGILAVASETSKDIYPPYHHHEVLVGMFVHWPCHPNYYG